MKTKLTTKKDQGFTIIEVLIVLAIAGLIMLIVFLAVPALQRNSRNTQRNNDAALVATSINECLNNRNGQIKSCQKIVTGTDTEGVSIDTEKLRQLSNSPTYSSTPPASTLEVAAWTFGYKCKSDGSGADKGTPRQFAVTYAVESATGEVGRCIDG